MTELTPKLNQNAKKRDQGSDKVEQAAACDALTGASALDSDLC